jgi:hypothetical protein
MNEMRLLDPFAIDPFEDAVRSMMRPWRTETTEAPPREASRASFPGISPTPQSWLH